jgi:hypothetical protein
MKRVFAVFFTVAMMITGAALAQGHGAPPPPFGAPEGGPGGPGAPGGPGGGLAVGSDGTVYVTSTTVSNNTASTTIKAIRSTGTVVWTTTVASRVRPLISDGNLLYVTVAEAADGTVTSTINAISTATGAAAWTRALGGHIAELRPFSNGTYVVTVTPPATSGGTPTRTLTAVGNDGSILWTLAL